VTAVVVPISAPDTKGLNAQVDRAFEAGADLIELRIDLCAEAGLDPAEAVAAIRGMRLPAIATNRSREEGGAWQGSQTDRLELLRQAAATGADYVDCELTAHQALGELPGRARLVLSHHDFEGMGDDLPEIVQRMYAAGATIAKVAVTPRDAAELDPLAELCARWGSHGEEAIPGKGLVAIGMGEHGAPSRLLAGAWGSAWSFGQLDGQGTAPGQPSAIDLLQRYRVANQGPDTRIFGVLGNPVAHSLSPLIHNAAFRADDLDAVYVPFLADDPLAFWRACGAWIDGLSITIPHKTALIEEMDEVEQLALKIGAINTIYRGEEGQTIGANTDAPAAVDCVQKATGSIAGRRVLLLGAGGVSRAVAFALQAAGAEVVISNRTAERAQALADEVGCRWIAAEDATDEPYEVLINGTSVGMESEHSPWPPELHRPGSVVFDTVYTPLETRLLQDAQATGGTPVCGLSMLVTQALGQYERWTGLEAPEPLMHRVALEALSTRWTTRIRVAHGDLIT